MLGSEDIPEWAWGLPWMGLGTPQPHGVPRGGAGIAPLPKSCCF